MLIMCCADNFKPIRNFGYFFILFGILGFLAHFFMLHDKDYTFPFQFQFISISLLNLLIGRAIIAKKRWGFYALKLFLYGLYLAIPIGPYVAFKTFEYIKKHNIERCFD